MATDINVLNDSVIVTANQSITINPSSLLGNNMPEFMVDVPENSTPILYINGEVVDSRYDETTKIVTPINTIENGTYEVSYALIDASQIESARSPALTFEINDDLDTNNASLVANNDDIPSSLANEAVIIPPDLLLANDTDANGGVISPSAIGDTVNGTVTFDGANVIFTPTQGYTGPASFTYTITNAQGELDTATVNLTIEATDTPTTNQAPDAIDDQINANADGSYIITPSDLLANDSDPDGDVITAVGIQDATNGTVMFDGTNVIFTPDDGYTGPASLTYTISDNNGATDTATVNLVVEADTPSTPSENQAPTANDDVIAETDARVIVIAPSTLLANDSDTDGDAITAVGLQDATNGTVIFDGTNIIFTADDSYTGPASFTYTITDNNGGTDTATVSLMVGITTPSENQAPTATDDVIAETDANVIVIAPSDLLANDSDADGDAITAVGLQNATNGTVIFDGTNIIFTAEDGYTGPASFTYTVTDNNGGTDTATVNLTMTDTPIITPPNSEIIGDKADNQLLGNDENNVLFGDQGNDAIDGQAGDDLVQGGQGNDVLDGGAGSDTFVWGYNAIQTFGNGLETDTINNFTAEDKIDLRGLLQNIQSNDANLTAEAQLTAYLSFSYDATANGTVMGISALGSFTSGDVLQYGDQKIVITGVDLTQGGTIETIDIIRNLSENGILITDATGHIEGNPSYDVSQTQYNEILTGDDTDNQINGAQGDDIITAGAGDDLLQGGQGNDQLDGGAGADTFVWSYNDIQPFGNGREVDTIHNISHEDMIDLRDLLLNEQSNDANVSNAEQLDAYLNFSYDAAAGEQGGTVMAVSALGSFSGNDSQQLGDQAIVFSNIDFTQGGTVSDIAIIQNMLNNGNLITDVIT